MRPQYEYYDFCRDGQQEQAFQMIEDHRQEWSKEEKLGVVGRGLYTAIIYNKWDFCKELIKHYPKEVAPSLGHPDIWKGIVLHSDLLEHQKLDWLSKMLPLTEHLPKQEQHNALFVSYNMFMSMPRRGRDFSSVHRTFVENLSHLPFMALTNTTRDIVLNFQQDQAQAYFVETGFLWFANIHSQATGGEMKQMNEMVLQNPLLQQMMVKGLNKETEFHSYFSHQAPELWAFYEKQVITEHVSLHQKSSISPKKM